MKEKMRNEEHFEKNDLDHMNKSRMQSRAATLLLIVYDLLAVNMAYFLALWFRFDCRFSMIGDEYLMAWLHFVPVYSVFCLIVFSAFKL